MSWFKSKPKHVPPSGPITLNRGQFSNMVKTQPFGSQYKQAVGLALFDRAVSDCFTENLRSLKPTGFWSYGATGGPYGHTNLKFEDQAALDTFFNTAIRMLFELELKKIQNRREYVKGLKGKASGALYAQLQKSAEVETKYYTPKSHTPQLGAPAIPAKTGDVLNQAKALAWLTWGVQGDTSAFKKALFRRTKRDGSFPLGTDRTLLFQEFPSIVPIAPTYRGWNNAASMQKYPSNAGGMKLVDEVIIELAISPMPPRGDTRWYDLALYVFGALMTSQAFTDGNKRMSRLAYVLMLQSGGVPIVVPNGIMGGQLGDMM